jgi:hypothetical protein
MFEKIFGIFRKRKKTDISEEIPGGLGEDTFAGDSGGFEEDFDADTISLETGISGDSGFSDSMPGDTDVGVAADSGLDADLGLGEEPLGGVMDREAAPYEAEGPISPPPEAEEYIPKKRGGKLKGILVTTAIAVIGLAVGFFGVQPGIQVIQKITSQGPTLAQQLAAVDAENAQYEAQLTGYRAVGDIEKITAIRTELEKRSELLEQTKQIEMKIADRPSVEARLDRDGVQLENTNRNLVIQKGTFANVEKAVKQVEARNGYLIASTKKSLALIADTGSKAQVLKERLDPEDVQQAEAAALLHYSIRKSLEESMADTVPAS